MARISQRMYRCDECGFQYEYAMKQAHRSSGRIVCHTCHEATRTRLFTPRVPHTRGHSRYARLCLLVNYHAARWGQLASRSSADYYASTWYWRRLSRLQAAMDRAAGTF